MSIIKINEIFRLIYSLSASKKETSNYMQIETT